MAFFLNEPFPQPDEPKVIVRIATLFGLSISFILGVFQPFNFGAAGNQVWRYALIFGGITTFVILGYEFTLKYLLGLQRDRPGWTLWKWCLSNLILASCIATANYIFTTYEYGLNHNWHRFGIVLRSTLTIGILPVFALGAIIQARYARRNEKIAAQIVLPNKVSVPSGVVKIPVLYSEKTFGLDPQSILCIEAMQNYVQIYYQDQGAIKKKMLRNTLSRVAEVLASTSVIRSHRSFLVNKNRVVGVSGNAQGLKLDLKPSPGFFVPVSRKYLGVFK